MRTESAQVWDPAEASVEVASVTDSLNADHLVRVIDRVCNAIGTGPHSPDIVVSLKLVCLGASRGYRDTSNTSEYARLKSRFELVQLSVSTFGKGDAVGHSVSGQVVKREATLG